MKTRIAIVALVVLAFSPAAVATAANKYWKNSVGSGNWSGGNNWSNVSAAGADNGGVPGAGDIAHIILTDGADRTITYDVTAPPQFIVFVDLTGAGTNRTTFSMSGNTLTTQALGVGYTGRATFNHSGGIVNVNGPGLDMAVGEHAGANGIYNLSGTGALSVAHDLFVGRYAGSSGTFNQTGGTNTIANQLFIGTDSGSIGVYDLSDGTLSVANAIVGNSGIGTLTIQGTGSVSVGTNLSINSASNVNVNGGTLRFNTVSGTGGVSRLNYNAGAIRLAGNRTIGTDPVVSSLFGATPTIPTGKELLVEGNLNIATSLSVNGGKLSQVPGALFFSSGTSGNPVTLSITNGGKVFVPPGGPSFGSSIIVDGPGSSFSTFGGHFIMGLEGNAYVTISGGGTMTTAIAAFIGGFQDDDLGEVIATVTGPGSTWNIVGSLSVGGNGVMNIEDDAFVNAAGGVSVWDNAILNLNGGTLRFPEYSLFGNGEFNFNSGTIQFSSNRSIGTDANITGLFGASPVIPAGKGLNIEGTATLLTTLTVNGGTFSAQTLLMSPGAHITSTQSSIVNGAVLAPPGSTIDVAAGNLVIGDVAKVNGFYSNGTINAGSGTITLADANDAVLDSAALVALGSGANPGTLNAANGLTLDFGGNITGFGTVATPNNAAKPLINNGHITGNSAAERITLPGYVKGVGTFDNVNFTGTFSPGLSPTILSVGNVTLSPTSTLVMELGGTSPGSGYDQIQSTGTIELGGTLEIALINGFTPTLGQKFNLFTYATQSGDFTTYMGMGVGSHLGLRGSLSANGLQLSARPSVDGDINLDGTVNIFDINSVSANWSTAGPQGDANGDGVVNIFDINLISSNWGATGGVTAVPEPSCASLAVLAAVVLMLAVRRS